MPLTVSFLGDDKNPSTQVPSTYHGQDRPQVSPLEFLLSEPRLVHSQEDEGEGQPASDCRCDGGHKTPITDGLPAHCRRCVLCRCLTGRGKRGKGVIGQLMNETHTPGRAK